MEPTVLQLFGYSVSIGMVVSLIVEMVKFTEKMPMIGHVPFVKAIIDAVSKGNPMQIRVTVGILCVLANIGAAYYTTGSIPTAETIFATFNSFLTALGTYDFALKTGEKTVEEKTGA